jgi:hypothetical protein
MVQGFVMMRLKDGDDRGSVVYACTAGDGDWDIGVVRYRRDNVSL